MPLRMTRRTFLGYSAVALSRAHAGVVAFGAAAVSGVATGCARLKLPLPSFLTNRYRIQTDVGDIVLDLPRGVAGALARNLELPRKLLCIRLELPAAILLRLETKSPRSTATPRSRARIALTNVNVVLSGRAIVKSETKTIVPGDGFELSFAASSLFPEVSRERPIGLSFECGEAGTIRLQFATNTVTFGFPTSYAIWPAFNVVCLRQDIARDKEATIVIAEDLRFKLPGGSTRCGVVCHRLEVDLPALLHEATLELFKFPYGDRLFVDIPSTVGSDALLYWKPGILGIEMSPSQAIRLTNVDAARRRRVETGQYGCEHFAVSQPHTELLALGSREDRQGAPEANDDNPQWKTTWTIILRDPGATVGRPPWIVTPRPFHLVAGDRKRIFRMDPATVQAKTVEVANAIDRDLASTIRQELHAFGLEIEGLSAGGATAEWIFNDPGETNYVTTMDDRGKGTLSSTNGTAASHWLSLGDYLLQAYRIDELELEWQAGSCLRNRDGALEDVGEERRHFVRRLLNREICGVTIGHCKIKLRQLTWAGRLPFEFSQKATGDDGLPFRQPWVHVQSPRDDVPAYPARRSQVPPLTTGAEFRGQPIAWDQGANAVAAWRYACDAESGVGDETVEFAGSPLCPPPRAERDCPQYLTWLTSLSPDSLRASIRPTLPENGTLEGQFLLPPFSLREHPTEETEACRDRITQPPPPPPEWRDSAKPAFRRYFMWEPRTESSLPARYSSVDALLDGIASWESPITINAMFNAGIKMSGQLVSDKEREWAPPVEGEAVPPYRAINVTGLHATKALDLYPPNSTADTNDAIYKGLLPGLPTRPHARILRSIGAKTTPIAISPIGGSLDFDWEFGEPVNGLSALSLHTYLGRYQRNVGVVKGLLMPWGLRFQVLQKLFRGPRGTMEYCRIWSFLQPEQTYGKDADVRIHRLRPINPFTSGNLYLFKADIEVRQGSSWRVLEDQTLRGQWHCRKPSESAEVTEVVRFDADPDFKAPLTLLNDTVMQLLSIRWSTCRLDLSNIACVGSANVTDPCQQPTITVEATGNVYQSSTTEGIRLDAQTVSVTWRQRIESTNGEWVGARTDADKPAFSAKSMTLGPGLTRISNPFGEGADTKRFVSASAKSEYKYERDLSLKDVALLQLIPAVEKSDARGKLVLRYRYTYADNEGTVVEKTEFEGTIRFPDLASLTEPVCERKLKLAVAAQPKSFDARFTDTTTHAVLKADLGVPGFFILKDTSFTVDNGGTPDVHFGGFELCDGILASLINWINDKLPNFGGSGFAIDFYWPGLSFKWPFEFPDVPLGGGHISNLRLDIRGDLRFDFSRCGGSRGVFFAVILGKYQPASFRDLDWQEQRPDALGAKMMSLTKPLEFTFTPFTVRFTAIGGFIAVAKADCLPDPKSAVRLKTFMCLNVEGGLALSFDIAIVKASVSLTLSLRWYPWAEFVFADNTNDLRFCLTRLQIGIVIEGHACIIGLINITLHAEIMAMLALECGDDPSRVLSHVTFSGYASIEILFAKIEVHFTVNMDGLLGLKGCDKPCPPVARIGSSLDAVQLRADVRDEIRGFFTSRRMAA